MLDNDPKLTELQADISDLYNRILYVQIMSVISRKDLTVPQKADVIMAGVRELLKDLREYEDKEANGSNRDSE